MTDAALTRVQRWERRTEVPLLLLALAFLVAYAWPVLNPMLDTSLQTVLETVSWTVWAAFGVDFVIRMALADDRVDYAAKHWYDVALILLPLLRPLRLLRLLAPIRILDRSVGNSLSDRLLVYALGAATMSASLGAVAVLDAEQSAPNANIKAFGDAIWWATATVATVGYGDRVPVTTEGRFVAVFLMFIGVGFVGTITAAVASWLVARSQRERDERIASE